MKNLVLGVAISAAMFTGTANAALTLDPNTGIPVIDTNTTEIIYLSGSSAARGFIEELITNSNVPAENAVCDTTKPVWKFKDAGNGKSQNAYMCEMDANNAALAGIVTAKPNLLIYKRSAGGSAQGVSPLINQDAADVQSDVIEFLDISTGCTLNTAAAVGTLGVVVCPSTHLAVPDLGTSDVDPIQFRKQNTPTGFLPVSDADLDKLTVTGSVALTFGIPVTTDMRNGLQEAQFGITDPSCVGDDSEACMPSLSRNQLASIFTGKLNNWDELKVGGVSVFSNASAIYKGVGPTANRVHICRRVEGSGTQAQFGINFLNTPCNDAAAVPATDNTGLTEFAPVAQVHENSGSGDMTECLDSFDTGVAIPGAEVQNTYGKRWAIGFQALEKASTHFRFVKIDGIAPTLANVAAGKYFDFAELTFQYNTVRMNDASRANTKILADAIIASAGEPTVVGEINKKFTHGFHGTQEVGFMANPNAYTADVNGLVDLTKPVNPYTHANGQAPVNNCRIPMIKAGAATQI